METITRGRKAENEGHHVFDRAWEEFVRFRHQHVNSIAVVHMLVVPRGKQQVESHCRDGINVASAAQKPKNV